MTDAPKSPKTGILLALGGGITLSLNDLAIKALSGAYALHQVILIRAAIGMALVLGVIWVSRTGFRQLLTRRPGAHLFRVSIVMVSNITYFVGLSLLPLADAVATAFVAPLLVTLMSAVILGEQVGPRRWAAVGVGLIGVIVMTRPGEGVIQPAAILVLISAFCYASSHMMTRRMRDTESAMTLNFFVQIGFIVVSTSFGLIAGDGHLAQAPGSTWEFLFRPWIVPQTSDIWAFVATGIAVGVGGLMMSQAYRTTEAALVAPFEYIGMPMAILWGILFFGTWPDLTAWAGIALICGAGLYTLWRETVRRKVQDVAAPSGDI
ncbi:DMT family transporter [Tabrizicola fusiformis]|uniref:DMT family transporter n=1 Tax=Tabrizicola sp. SY72 TaxID=2741673 RepID=UPI001572DBF4|nr:DMT family transporter [Tabrizicola sp. SY72]NTT84394.1 DMT family transporter [Tabrizicola sp. SY72]